MAGNVDFAERRRRAALAAVATLAVSNVVSNSRIPLAAHVPWSLGVTAGLLGLARWAGCDAAELGLARDRLPGAARTGVAAAGAVTAAYGLMAASGVGETLLRDRRVTSMKRRDAWWHLLMRIPISTVLAEEVAFRAVLPALLDGARSSRRKADGLAAALFGVWHALPAWDGAITNGSSHRRATLAQDVTATAAAGALLLAVRRRTGHIIAPAAMHLAANAVGFAATRKLRHR